MEPGGCTHLESTRSGKLYPDELPKGDLSSEAPLFARYDLQAIGNRLRVSDLSQRPKSLWRYAELLPVRDPQYAICLGEGGTPLIESPRLAEALGVRARLFIKDESQNPTGSFKARGMAVAVSRAWELGAGSLALPTAGNAGSAAAAYAARAGLPVHIVMPRSTPEPIIRECRALGAQVELVDGNISDCGAKVREGIERHGWFDLSTLKEPYRVEGKKTMGYELAEDFDWRLPDVVVYPTGGGTGLVGMWKAFDEMQALGWIGAERPRMVSVQPQGCAPIVRAFQAGLDSAEPWQNPSTIAHGLCVPGAIGDFLMLRALRQSGGGAVAVSDGAMLEMVDLLGKTTGIFSSPEGAATLAALPELVETGVVNQDDRVVLFNTGSGLKYT